MNLPVHASTSPLVFVRDDADSSRAVVSYLSSLAEKSQRSMLSRLKKIATMLGYQDVASVPWHRLRYEHVSMIRNRLVEEGLSPSGVNTCLAAIRGVLRECWNLGLMAGEDFQRVGQVKGVKGTRLPAGRCLDQEEVLALLLVCDDSPAGIRDRAITLTLYSCGLRRSEICSLKLSCLDTDERSLTVIGKGNSERKVFLSASAMAAILAWLDIRGDTDGALFQPVLKSGKVQPRHLTDQAIYGILKKRGKQAGLRDFSPHDFRRNLASSLLDKGVDIVTCQKLLGHASVTTTARYDRRGDEAKRAAASLMDL